MRKNLLIFGGAGVVLAALVVVLVVLVFASPGKPDVSACKAAMQAQYAKALSDPTAPAATRPAACNGVPAGTLDRIATQIMQSTAP